MRSEVDGGSLLASVARRLGPMASKHTLHDMKDNKEETVQHRAVQAHLHMFSAEQWHEMRVHSAPAAATKEASPTSPETAHRAHSCGLPGAESRESAHHERPLAPMRRRMT